jgi:hypothetical protein
MPDDRETNSDDAILAVGGVLFVGAPVAGRSGVRVGPAAGWLVPRGIAQWERELSFVPRASMTPGLASALRATLADEQVAPKRFPTVKKAVEVSPLLALGGNLVEDVRAQGVRVHTVGVDRVSGDFFYFEEGGGQDPLRVQGNLVEMLSPTIGSSSTNAEIAAGLDGLLDRLLRSLSGGVVSELAVELADALPRLSRDGTGLVGTDLDAFEARSSAFAARSARWEAGARRIPAALDEAARKGLRSTPVALFGEAQREERGALEVVVAGKTLSLPAVPLWTVKGAPREEAKPAPSPAPVRATPSPLPARPAPSPASPRVAPSPSPARPTPSPSSPRVSPSPLPARPSPTPAPSRIVVIGPEAPTPIKPTPLRYTPVPPRPEPVAPPAAAPVPALVTPDTSSTAPTSPASAPAPAPAPAPASASAPAPAPASAPASVSAASAPEPSISPDEATASSRTATTGRPDRAAVPAKKNSPSTLVLALLALAALAYIAFERFIH